MQDVKKNMESVLATFKQEGFETGQSKLNSSYRDEYLNELKQHHEELRILNQQLNREVEEFLKENRNS